MADSVTVQLNSILDEYSRKVDDVTQKAIASVARQSVNKLKSTSPKKTGSYARGWSAKRERSGGHIDTIIVHNRTDYQLTHLLENGHVIRNKKGTYGRTRPIKHIAPVADWADSELQNEIERKL